MPGGALRKLVRDIQYDCYTFREDFFRSKKRGTENISCLHSLFLEGKLQMVDSVKALRGVTNTNKDCEGNPKLQLCTIFSYRLLTSSLSLFITITIVGE